MRAIAIAPVMAVFLSGCIQYGTSGSAFTETSAVCDVPGIETQYSYLKDQSRSWRGALAVGTPKGGGAITAGRERADVERETVSIARQLDVYDAEIDAQYRTVTSACKAYSRCMEMNGYSEAKCRSSMARWEASEREFTNLSRDLAEIGAQIENLRTVARSGRRGPRRVNKCEDGVCY